MSFAEHLNFQGFLYLVHCSIFKIPYFVLFRLSQVVHTAYLLYHTFFKKLKVILLAEALYADVKKYVSRKDVFICPNGIPESLTTEASAVRHNAIPKLLYLSNLLINKGVFTLLDTCKILKDTGYQFTCDFVGGETAEINAERFNQEVAIRGLNTCMLQRKEIRD